jgi:hypothetical protein
MIAYTSMESEEAAIKRARKCTERCMESAVPIREDPAQYIWVRPSQWTLNCDRPTVADRSRTGSCSRLLPNPVTEKHSSCCTMGTMRNNTDACPNQQFTYEHTTKNYTLCENVTNTLKPAPNNQHSFIYTSVDDVMWAEQVSQPKNFRLRSACSLT